MPQEILEEEITRKEQTQQISLRVRQSTFNYFKELANNNELTVSEVINNLLNIYAERNSIGMRQQNDLVVKPQTSILEQLEKFKRGKVVKITKCGRLRQANMGHYDSYFSIDVHGNILEVKYLPEIKSDPKKMYYKSCTEKGGDFLYIQDICQNLFGPEPDTKEGWHYDVETLYRDDERGVARYRIITEQ